MALATKRAITAAAPSEPPKKIEGKEGQGVPGVVFYTGRDPMRTENLPGVWNPETDSYSVYGRLTAYVFDRKDKEGRWWALCNHPGHLLAFGLMRDAENVPMYELAVTDMKKAEMADFHRRYRILVESIRRGFMVTFRERRQASQEEADIAALVGD